MIEYLFNQHTPLPDPATTEDEVVAIGGNLTVERLLEAYNKGIFPWFNEGDPILWWCPEERMVLYPHNLKVSKSMKQIIKKGIFEITVDTAFNEVIKNCSKIKRHGQDDTWITREMIDAYIELHKEGFAHSVEVWREQQLVGGLYGVSLGKCFFGESMFAKESNTSKLAFIHLVENLKQKCYHFIDCQVYTEHLESLGAEIISKVDFLAELQEGLQGNIKKGSWSAYFNQVFHL